jgi:hypothetical protein
VGTTSTHLVAGVGIASATLGGLRSELYAAFPAGTGTASFALAAVPVRFSLAAAGTAYLVALATFSAAMTAGGTISARRVR